MTKEWGILLLMALLVFSSCKNTAEEDHPYNNEGLPSTQDKQDELLPGLPNLGATCFANASLNALLSSQEILKILNNPFLKVATDTPDHHSLRVKFHASLKALYDTRKKPGGNVTDALNEYFDAFEKARKPIIAGGAADGEKVGGKDKLRKEQGDARDFIEDNLTLLAYARQNPVTVTYNVFTDDNTTKVFHLHDLIIGLTIDGLPDQEHSVQDLYENWLKPQFMGVPNRVEKAPGNYVDSNRYYTLREPANPSLFFAALRFAYDLTGKPARKLNPRITPTMTLNVKTKDEANLTNVRDHRYTLRAIVIHHGALGGGHYYAYVYNNIKNRWEKYNDMEASVASTTAVSEDAQNSYLYLYELQTK